MTSKYSLETDLRKVTHNFIGRRRRRSTNTTALRTAARIVARTMVPLMQALQLDWAASTLAVTAVTVAIAATRSIRSTVTVVAGAAAAAPRAVTLTERLRPYFAWAFLSFMIISYIGSGLSPDGDNNALRKP